MTVPSNVISMSDRSALWPDSDDERFLEDYKDLWIAVLRRSLEDYWQGIRKGQHKKLGAIRIIHRGRRDAEEYRDWLNAAHWLLSDDTRPRSFCWLMKILRLEPDVVRSRMNNPPARDALVDETEEED
jgi:hypothetical protein